MNVSAETSDKKQYRTFKINDITIGQDLVLFAGPCSIENRDVGIDTALKLASGVRGLVFRGGIFKARTSPGDFQGLGIEGLSILKEIKELTGLPVVTEILDPRDIEEVADVVDVLQIGSRNMQNFTLIKEAGATQMPVLLKRGMSATLKEWLCSAQYVINEGNDKLILCERGIRTFNTYMRNTLDISAIEGLRKLTDLPVIVDPSHGCGELAPIPSMSYAALSAGAAGLMIETHIRPREALCDINQAMDTDNFIHLSEKLGKLYTWLKKESYT